MKERPILFSGPIVRAILEGRKTQTRRVVKMPAGFSGKKPVWNAGELCLRVTAKMASGPQEEFMSCPYGVPGDRLWVRETFVIGNPEYVARYKAAPWLGLPCSENAEVYYRESTDAKWSFTWRPSIFMPRWASRILLEVVKVRVERVQSISEGDAAAEGVKATRYKCTLGNGGSLTLGIDPYRQTPPLVGMELSAGGRGEPGTKSVITAAVPCNVDAYAELWDSINDDPCSASKKARPYGWAKNPWVWVVEFRRVA